MAKYKIYTDRPKISDEEAEKQMDFDFVLKSNKSMHSPLYVIRNIFRKPKIMRRIILIMIITLLVIFSIIDEKNKGNKQSTKKIEKVNSNEVTTPSE